jgi:hypothetical protein
MIGQIEHTRYFHINFQTGELMLIRPIEELINKTRMIELHINITNDWIHMNTIKVKLSSRFLFDPFVLFRLSFILKTIHLARIIFLKQIITVPSQKLFQLVLKSHV